MHLRKAVLLCSHAAIVLALSQLFCSDVTNPFYVPPEITYPDSLVCHVGDSIEQVIPSLALNVDIDSYTVSVPLPEGLKMDPLTGDIAGMPQGAPGSSMHVIHAHNEWGVSNDAALIVVVCPAAPVGLSASAIDSTGILIGWEPVEGAAAYHVLRSAVRDGPYAVIGTPQDTAYRDLTVQIGQTYYYHIVATHPSTPASLPSDTIEAELVIIVPPGVPAVSGRAVTNDPTPTWTWSSNGGVGRFRYALDSDILDSASEESTDTSYTPSAALSEGMHTLYVWERGDAGTWSTPGTFGTTIDTTPPSPPEVSGPSLSADSTPTWTWTPGGGGMGQFRYKFNDPDLTVDATETIDTAYTPSEPLQDGVYRVYVQECDYAGNWSQPASFAVRVDITPPEAPVVDAPVVTNRARPLWTWTRSTEGMGMYRVRLDNGTMSEDTASTFTPSSDLADGSHSLFVQERDSAGNWSEFVEKAVVVRSNVVFVDDDAGGVGDGSSWRDAFGSLDSGLVVAGNDQSVWVAEGMYTPSNENGFDIRTAVLGGFTNQDTDTIRDWANHLCVFDGDLGIQGVNSDNALHVVVLHDGALLEACVIANGNAHDGSHFRNGVGGGVLAFGGTLRHCVVRDNEGYKSPYRGIACLEDSVTIDGCAVIGNELNTVGGLESTAATDILLANCIFVNSPVTIETLRGATITNSVFVQESEAAYAPLLLMSPTSYLLNTIVVANGPDVPVMLAQEPSYVIRNCCIPGWGTTYDGYVGYADVLDTVPGFQGGALGTDSEWFSLASPYALETSTSPCVDAGHYMVDGQPGRTVEDIRGAVRPTSFTEQSLAPIDIGPYEQHR